MAGESIMGIAKDLAVPVLDKLSTAGSAEVYGKRIGRLYRTLLKEVEAARRETLVTRGVSSQFPSSEFTELGGEE